jgi:hypothetical protein
VAVPSTIDRKLKWPPTDEEWGEVLQPLPPAADRSSVQQAVEAAVREYLKEADQDQRLREVYRRIGRYAGSQGMKKVCQAILQLKGFPIDSVAEGLLRQVEPNMQIHGQAKVRAAIHLTTARDGRLMSRLSLVWTGPGKGKLPISETGPFVEFFSSIYRRVFRRPIDGSGVKRFVRREWARREILTTIKLNWAGQGGFKIDESGVYVIDARGQRKPS